MSYKFVLGHGHQLAKLVAMEANKEWASNTKFIHIPKSLLNQNLLLVLAVHGDANKLDRHAIQISYCCYADAGWRGVYSANDIQWFTIRAGQHTFMQEFLATEARVYEIACPLLSGVSYTLSLAEFIDPDEPYKESARFKVIKHVSVEPPTIAQLMEKKDARRA